MTSNEAERIAVGILDGWFGEPVENAEDEKQKRHYLYDPMVKLVRLLAGYAAAAEDDASRLRFPDTTGQ
jgi:hypothetical protein